MSIQFKPFICSCHELGILIAPDKTVHVGLSGNLTFGGIELDSFKYERHFCCSKKVTFKNICNVLIFNLYNGFPACSITFPSVPTSEQYFCKI